MPPTLSCNIYKKHITIQIYNVCTNKHIVCLNIQKAEAAIMKTSNARQGIYGRNLCLWEGNWKAIFTYGNTLCTNIQNNFFKSRLKESYQVEKFNQFIFVFHGQASFKHQCFSMFPHKVDKVLLVWFNQETCPFPLQLKQKRVTLNFAIPSTTWNVF